MDVEGHKDRARRAVAAVTASPGVIEQHAKRSMLGAPYVRTHPVGGRFRRFDEGVHRAYPAGEVMTDARDAI